MGQALLIGLAGVVMMSLMGSELLKAYRTDSTPVGRSRTLRVSREKHPRVFWFAVTVMAIFFAAGLSAAGGALMWLAFFRGP